MKGKEKIEEGVLRDHLEKVAKRLFSLSDWIENYGKPIYYLRSADSARQLLQNKNLADEWDIYKFDFRHYVFLSSDKRGKTKNETRIKFPPKLVEKIRQMDFSVKGTQRKLAKELKCSESHLSRIRRYISRTADYPAKTLKPSEKEKLFISRKEVKEFFELMITIKDFRRICGEEINNKTSWDISNMCANRRGFKLPLGWHSIRVANSWLIYKINE